MLVDAGSFWPMLAGSARFGPILADSAKLNIKVVNKDVVLFKSIDQENNYSESGIITRKTGELIHEITRNLKSENAEKYISIYSCIKHDQKV